MDTANVEEFVQLSTTGYGQQKLHATQQLEAIRQLPEKWSVGLKLFFEGSSDIGRFFGLSLIREYLSAVNISSDAFIRESIRTALMTWLSSTLVNPIATQQYMLNNAISVITLSVKNDYPELWPGAFSELLQLGYANGVPGIDFISRIVMELETEVVVFNELRGKAEIAHNVVVKDKMRETTVVKDLCAFLCNGSVYLVTHTQRFDIAAASMKSLAGLIGWIDVQIVVSDALPTIYKLWTIDMGSSLELSAVRAAAGECLCEFVRKGMDPVLKVHFVNTSGLIAQLNAIDIEGMISWASQHNTVSHEVEQLGLLLDTLVQELFGCWSKFEDHMWKVFQNGGNLPNPQSGGTSANLSPVTASVGIVSSSSSDLEAVTPLVVDLLKTTLPKLICVFHSADTKVAACTLQACNRFVGLLKNQLQRPELVIALRNRSSPNVETGTHPIGVHDSKNKVFIAEEFANVLLMGIYNQSKFPCDFDFEGVDTGDDELMGVVEAKDNVRKLFVNCCRIIPRRCLDLIAAALSDLPQPLSQAPFDSLEVTLRLLHSFSECGPQHYNSMVAQGLFPQLIQALHQTDVTQHPHPQVVLNFFELAQRHLKLVNLATIQQLSLTLLGQRGVQNTQFATIRQRAAYIALRVAEGMEGRSAQLITSVGPLLKDILVSHALSQLSTGAVSDKKLTEQSEYHLGELFGLVASSNKGTPMTIIGQQSSNNSSGLSSEELQIAYAKITDMQVALLNPVIEAQITVIQNLVSALQNQSSDMRDAVDMVIPCLTRRIWMLGCLCKGFNYKTHETFAPMFMAAVNAVVAVVCTFKSYGIVLQALFRSKVLVFFHRMIRCVGVHVIESIKVILPALLATAEVADIEETIQLLHQVMIEFAANAMVAVDAVFCDVVEKLHTLSAGILEETAGAVGVCSSAEAQQVALATTAPQVIGERILLRKLYILFIQHVVTYQCSAILVTPAHVKYLQEVMSAVLAGLKGHAITNGNISVTSQLTQDQLQSVLSQYGSDSLSIRRASLLIVAALVQAWIPPLLGSTTLATTITTPPQIQSSFKTFLFQEALPNALHSVTPPCFLAQAPSPLNTSDIIAVNVRDAAAQGVLVEIAALLRTIFTHCCKISHVPQTTQALTATVANNNNNLTTINENAVADLHVYITSTLQQSLGWPKSEANRLWQLLSNDAPLGTFKDTLKKLLREIAQ